MSTPSSGGTSYPILWGYYESRDVSPSDRPYRNTVTKEEAIDELRNKKGKQFDPMVVESFIKSLNMK